MSKRHHLQFDFSEEALKHLDALQKKAGARTRAVVLQRALWCYEALVEHALAGHDITMPAADLRRFTNVEEAADAAE